MKTKGTLKFVFTNGVKTVHNIGQSETREAFAKRVSKAINTALTLHDKLKTFSSYRGKSPIPVHRKIGELQLTLGGKDCSDALKGFTFAGREFHTELEDIIATVWAAYDSWRRNGGQSFQTETAPKVEAVQAN